jgi:hypothetical protein
VLVAFATLLIAPLASPPAAAPVTADERPGQASPRDRATRRLASVGFEIAEELVHHRPWLVRERALGWAPAEPFRPGSDDAHLWRWFLDSAHADLAAIPSGDLRPRQQIERDWLYAWVLSEQALAESRAVERNDPAWYASGAERYFRALVESTPADAGQRRQQIIRELERLPGVWRDAQRSLSAPTAEASASAALGLLDLLHLLDVELPVVCAPFGWTWEERTRSEKARKAAVRATREFRQWLTGAPTRAGTGAQPVGAENWGQMAGALSGSPLTPGQLKAQLLRELARLDGVRVPRSAEEVLGLREPALQEATVRAGSKLGMQLAVDAGVLADVGKQVEVRARDDFAAPGPAYRLWSPDAGVYRVEVERPGSAWPAEVAATREASLADDLLRANGLRLGFPGEAMWRHQASSQGDRGGAAVWNRAAREGWALYALDWAARIDWVDNPIRSDAGLISAMARLRALEAARLTLTIEMHVEELADDELAVRLIRRVGLDPATAELEVERAHRDPLYGIGYLGYLEIRRLEEHVRQRQPWRHALETTLGFLLAHPNARPGDLLRRFGGRPDER